MINLRPPYSAYDVYENAVKAEIVIPGILLDFYAPRKQETVLWTEVLFLRLANQETALWAENSDWLAAHCKKVWPHKKTPACDIWSGQWQCLN
jgi:hypothetical protein